MYRQNRSKTTSVEVEDGVCEQVAADLRVDVGAGTADRAAATDAVPTDRQTAVAEHRRRVVSRQLDAAVTITLTHRSTRNCRGWLVNSLNVNVNVN